MSGTSKIDNINQSSLWWLKQKVKESSKTQVPDININNEQVDLTPDNMDLDISTSIDEFLENDPNYNDADDGSEADIGSIIQEIHKLASESPIGKYETSASDNKSVEEILQEAEKLYLESSKSFEQLSSKSRTSLDYSISKSSSLSFRSKKSTPSPKSSYSAVKSIQESAKLYTIADQDKASTLPDYDVINSNKVTDEVDVDTNHVDEQHQHGANTDINDNENPVEFINEKLPALVELELQQIDEHEHECPMEHEEVEEEDIVQLHEEIDNLKIQLKQTKAMVDEKERSLQKQAYGLQQQLATRLEQLKDTQEQNTALQLQLDTLAKTHQELRAAYDELVESKRGLESRIAELDASFGRCRAELGTLREHHNKLLESETTLKKQLEIEKLASKTARLQSDKDAKCIQDLNRQVKEMERILQRKHPDSVSTVLAAVRAEPDGGLTARSLLESRIRQLENEASAREAHSNSLFTDIQDKFSQMKAKYESHIEDLEIHVNDLKRQLQSRAHTYDIYTQTYELPTTVTTLSPPPPPPIITINTVAATTQTEEILVRPVRASSAPITNKKATEAAKEDAHLLATIRGLQVELAAKEKLLTKLHKEVEELRKTNRKLQKEREAILREKRDHKHHVTNVKTPDTNVTPATVDILHHNNNNHGGNDHDADDESEKRALRDERDKLKAQLCRLEDDYQNLKTKRLQDLNTLQEAHERELSTYMSNIGPMREQLDVQQVSIRTLQQQLANAKEELAIVRVEREHLETRLQAATLVGDSVGTVDENALQKKIAYLERRYEEREHRLRAIVHGLAQKQVSDRGCSQCAARHQQLIGYKAELDQLLATLRYLQ